ncbi:hypothetical protein WJX81_005264 [Elliptochloris bilobata]|uniref:Expansin n=1 Tax=Elliptochloris bilobata TaxID=381761 RepID=A0AAW1RXN5_9CHLO
MRSALRTSAAVAAAAAALAVLAVAAHGSPDGLPTDWRVGKATYYGGQPDGMSPYDPSYGTSIGSCGYGLLDKAKYPFWSVAALSTSNCYFQGGPLQGCGQCFQIECLQDEGPHAGHCNEDPNERSMTDQLVQALTYLKIAPWRWGVMDIRYRRVQCTPPNDVKVLVDQNRGAGQWLRLSIQAAGGQGAVKAVQVKGRDGAWQGMTNKWGAAWEMDAAPDPPLDINGAIGTPP